MPFSSFSPFSPPPPANDGLHSPAKVVLNVVADFEKWRTFIVALFIKANLLGDLIDVKSRCLPLHAAEIAAPESAFWTRLLNNKVSQELRNVGLAFPAPFVARVFQPTEMKFTTPDYSASAGTAKEKRDLITAATALFNQTRALFTADQEASAVRHEAANAAAFKEHATISKNYEHERLGAYTALSEQYKREARVSIWLQIISSLGQRFHALDQVVVFGEPAKLIISVEKILFQNPDGEKQALHAEFITSSLAVQGGGDPEFYYRYVFLTANKLAKLGNEQVRDFDMRQILVQGLPDEIFLDFKALLHNNPTTNKTFEDVFQTLKLWCSSKLISAKIDNLILQCSRQYKKPVSAGVFVATGSRPRAPPRERNLQSTPTQGGTVPKCYDFEKGKCARGAGCRFSHALPISSGVSSSLVCAFCGKKGHLEADCFGKHPEKRPQRGKKQPQRNSLPPGTTRSNYLLHLRNRIDEELYVEGAAQDSDLAPLFTITHSERFKSDHFPALPKRSQELGMKLRGAMVDSPPQLIVISPPKAKSSEVAPVQPISNCALSPCSHCTLKAYPRLDGVTLNADFVKRKRARLAALKRKRLSALIARRYRIFLKRYRKEDKKARRVAAKLLVRQRRDESVGVLQGCVGPPPSPVHREQRVLTRTLQPPVVWQSLPISQAKDLSFENRYKRRSRSPDRAPHRVRSSFYLKSLGLRPNQKLNRLQRYHRLNASIWHGSPMKGRKSYRKELRLFHQRKQQRHYDLLHKVIPRVAPPDPWNIFPPSFYPHLVANYDESLVHKGCENKLLKTVAAADPVAQPVLVMTLAIFPVFPKEKGGEAIPSVMSKYTQTDPIQVGVDFYYLNDRVEPSQPDQPATLPLLQAALLAEEKNMEFMARFVRPPEEFSSEEEYKNQHSHRVLPHNPYLLPLPLILPVLNDVRAPFPAVVDYENSWPPDFIMTREVARSQPTFSSNYASGGWPRQLIDGARPLRLKHLMVR